MEPRPILRFGGPAWELARTALLLLFLAVGSSTAGTPDMPSAPWLAAAGAAGLVLPAAFVLFCLSPGRYRPFLPLLIMGKIFEAGTLVLLFATGAVTRAVVPGLNLDPFRAYAVGAALILDVVVLVGLVRLRADG